MILSVAVAGTIVFMPSPAYPDWIPVTSAVGRTQMRSSVENPASPVRAAPAAWPPNSSSEKGSAAIVARTSSVTGRTAS